MDMERTDMTSTYDTRDTEMQYDDTHSGMDPRMLIAAIAGLALVIAAVLLVASPPGRRARHDTVARLDTLNKQGRKSLESALHSSRKQLAQLEKESRHRVGDLKHRAKLMRMKADVRRLEKQLMH